MKAFKKIIFFLVIATFLTVNFFSPCKGMEHNKEDPQETNKVVRILSIQGGGIRGLIPARILQHWEEELQVEFGRKVPISECFDIVAGTSTGGIIALGLTYKAHENSEAPEYYAEDMVKFYQESGKEIFPPSEWEFVKNLINYFTPAFNPQPLETFLENKFKERYLSTISPQVIVPAYEMKSNIPYAFDSLEARVKSSQNFKIRDVARATSAAPSFLKAPTIHPEKGEEQTFLDGGIFANDPTLIAIQKAQQRFPKAKKFIVVSLGTGEERPGNLSEKLGDAGQVKWAPYIADFMMRCNSKTTKDSISSLQSLYENMIPGGSFSYIHIQPPLDQLQKAMDNTHKVNIDGLIGIARSEIKENSKISEVTKLLKQYLHSRGYQSKNIIGDDHTQQLTLSVKLKRRGNTLNLEDRNITNNDLPLIRSLLEGNQTLTELNLGKNQIDSDAAESLKDLLALCPKITRLILDDNKKLGKNGTQPLETHLKITNLQYLSVKNTNLNEKDIIPLMRLVGDLESLKIAIGKVKIDDRNLSKDLLELVSAGIINVDD